LLTKEVERMSMEEKVKKFFKDTVVFKSPQKNKMFSSLSIPSYLRDWLLMRFSDENGEIEFEAVKEYISKYIPRKNEWEALKAKITKGEKIKFLAKLRVEIDIKKGKAVFSLPDFSFPKSKYEAIIEKRVLNKNEAYLFDSTETWGVIELEWRDKEYDPDINHGIVLMTDFKPFKPYNVDLDFYKEMRGYFNFEEWIDVLLMAIDFNPNGFLNIYEKITLLSRLLPFVENRVNIIELAPKGTGKSYVFAQISKYGWLVSGGSVSRARMFYDIAKKTVGLVSRYDYVALDEIQTISFPDENEVKGALKSYMESGEYRVGDFNGAGKAGIILLGNIDIDSMNINNNMLLELPKVFHESALIDRFHGFIKGWDIPRIKENMKVNGWALNTEYFSEILHVLREDISYRVLVEEILDVPRNADGRDTEAIKRLTTAFMKLFFPNVTSKDEIDVELFKKYCLEPAKAMRAIIRKQLHIMDKEYSPDIPNIGLKE